MILIIFGLREYACPSSIWYAFCMHLVYMIYVVYLKYTLYISIMIYIWYTLTLHGLQWICVEFNGFFPFSVLTPLLNIENIITKCNLMRRLISFLSSQFFAALSFTYIIRIWSKWTYLFFRETLTIMVIPWSAEITRNPWSCVSIPCYENLFALEIREHSGITKEYDTVICYRQGECVFSILKYQKITPPPPLWAKRYEITKLNYTYVSAYYYAHQLSLCDRVNG